MSELVTFNIKFTAELSSYNNMLSRLYLCLNEGLANFLYQGLDSKYFQLSGPYSAVLVVSSAFVSGKQP